MKRTFFSLMLLAAAPFARGAEFRVLDPMRAAIPNARLEAGSVSAVTGGDGAARLTLSPPVTVRVTAPGFEPAEIRVDAPPTREITVVLRPAIQRTAVEVIVRDEPAPGTSVSTALEIERTGARTVFDAVDQLVPGAFVTRRGVMGYGIATNGAGGVTIRGIGGQPNTGVLIVVDGRPDMQGLMGHPLPDFYSLSDVGTISVIEGPASVLYGTNAMGGVIEVKPNLPRAGLSNRYSSSLGSFLTGQHRLGHAMRWEKFYYSTTAGVSHTGGDRPSSAFRNQDGSLNLGYTFSNAWRGGLEGRYGHFHVEDPGPVTAPLNNAYARVGRGGYSASLDNVFGRAWGYARLFQSWGKHYITDGFRSTDNTTGFRLSENFMLAREVTAQVGADYVRYGGKARNVVQRVNYGEHHQSTAAGFGRLQWAPGARLRMHAGLRYDSNSVSGDIVVPEAGLSFTPRDGYTLAFAMARGFRNPTIRELYLFPAPNPALKPERLWNYQASFQGRPHKSVLFSVTGYYADLSNMIVTLGRFPNLQLANAGAALNRGVETSVRWRPAPRLSLQSSYAYLRSTHLAPFVPPHKFNYGAEFDAKRFFVHFGGSVVSERWADAARTRKLGGYSLGMLRVVAPVRRSINVFATVENLYNRAYQVVPNYPMPGVTSMGGFSVTF